MSQGASEAKGAAPVVPSKPAKKEAEPARPISPVAAVVFVVKAAVLSAAVVGLIVLLLGWRHVTAPHTSSPSALPLAVSRHLEQGVHVPIHDGERGVTLFAVHQGVVDSSEETVLLLHDLPGSSLSYTEAQDELASQGIASLAIDLPGFGLSDKPAGAGYSLDYLARAAMEAMTSLHIDSAHVVARGASCFVAARMAEQWPALINSLVLLDCAPPPTRAPNLALFAFEHSPALPQWAHAVLFGAPASGESGEVAAANRWLTAHKGGQESFFAYCASGGQSSVGEEPFAGMCDRRNCAMTGLAKPVEGMVQLQGPTLGHQLARFVKQLPAETKQNKKAKAAPRVQYAAPSGDKYGAHDHSHGAHEHGAHQHGTGCSHHH